MLQYPCCAAGENTAGVLQAWWQLAHADLAPSPWLLLWPACLPARVLVPPPIPQVASCTCWVPACLSTPGSWQLPCLTLIPPTPCLTP